MTAASSVRSDGALKNVRCVSTPRLPEHGNKVVSLIECTEYLEGAICRDHRIADFTEGQETFRKVGVTT
ncbi:hypothetical protein KYN89_14025 [Alteriqipengyuania sp. NZ-12B]|uniref:Uncharacterized protein n=1 Tax=Alteriqipengyuania abyssalis TaxID=2860200 RepID=A0ABS7PGG6_9SPHN|nr:hypothetical protein [Alteriqipengyuania abyssalis]MBY8338164.1 hypothetical protein [Alteriqipengyuania abyssalis]